MDVDFVPGVKANNVAEAHRDGAKDPMGTELCYEQNFLCVQSEELIREHGKKGGFRVIKITEISSVISPATATN